MDDRQCTYINPKNHRRCRGYKGNDSEFCFTHDPAKTEERELAHSRGGQNHYNIVPVETKLDVETALGLIEEQVSELRGMPPSTGKSRTIFAGLELALRVLEVTDLERRISRLEKQRGINDETDSNNP